MLFSDYSANAARHERMRLCELFKTGMTSTIRLVQGRHVTDQPRPSTLTQSDDRQSTGLKTRNKILIARAITPQTTVTRGGILWSLDLEESIDLAIYLFGRFESATVKYYCRLVSPGQILLYIGANIGAHTLPMATMVGVTGKVIAFEPTQYAFDKLKTNVAVNPGLAPRIEAHQTMLMSQTSEGLPEEVYSSWPLRADEGLHPWLKGRLMPTQGAIA